MTFDELLDKLAEVHDDNVEVARQDAYEAGYEEGHAQGYVAGYANGQSDRSTS